MVENPEAGPESPGAAEVPAQGPVGDAARPADGSSRLPAWVPAVLLGVAWAVLVEAGRYLAIYFALGGNGVLATGILVGFLPLVYLVSVVLVGRWFGSRPYFWTLVAWAVAILAQSALLALGFSLFSGAGLTARLFLQVLVQQAICLPLAVLGAWWVARRRGIGRR